MILFFKRISPKSITKKMTHWNKKKLNWSKKDVGINDLLSNVLIFVLLCKNTKCTVNSRSSFFVI